MKVLRTPNKCFDKIKGYPFKPIYTDISSNDGTELRIHHIDEGPENAPILLAMHGQPVWSYLYSKMIPILNKNGVRVIAPDLIGYGKSDKPSSREDYSYQNQVDWMNQWLIKNDFQDLTFFIRSNVAHPAVYPILSDQNVLLIKLSEDFIIISPFPMIDVMA